MALLTLVSLGVLAAAGILIDCAAPYLGVFGDRTSQFCDQLSTLGLVSDPLIAIGISLTSAIAVGVIWRSALRRWRRRRRVESTGALVNNIHRLVEMPRERGALGEWQVDSYEGQKIWKRIDEVARAMRSPESVSTEIASTWLGLLRHANGLHHNGQLPTEEFRVINTRLLDLVSEDSERTGAATVG